MVSAVVPIIVRCADWAKVVEVYEKDLSHGGLFIETNDPRAIFSEVEVLIVPPDERHNIKLSAEVVHLVDKAQARQNGTVAGMGLQIKNMSDKQGKALRDLVRLAQRQIGSPRTGETAAVSGSTSSAPVSPASRRGSSVQPVLSTSAFSLLDVPSLRALLREQVNWFRHKDPATALGIATPVNPDFARKVYLKLCKKYHPDRFARYGDTEITDLVTELFALIRNSYTKTLAQASTGDVQFRRGRPSEDKGS